MPVVSDTSPILGLSAIGHLELLQEQFEEVLIPQAVLAELKVGTDYHGTDAIQKALNDGWLKLKTNRLPDHYLWNWIKGNLKQSHWQWIWAWK